MLPKVTTVSPTARTTGQRYPERVTHDREAAYAILDEALAVHVGFNTDEGPVVIPTPHMREGDQLLLHGSAFGRFITTAAAGAPAPGAPVPDAITGTRFPPPTYDPTVHRFRQDR